MKKHVLWLDGAPRAKGNTAVLSEEVMKCMRSSGAEIEVVDLCALENIVGGCCGCLGCQPDKLKCVVRDETAKLVNRLPHEFEVIVLSSPIYFFGLSAQTKRFIDRLMAMVQHLNGGFASPLKEKRFGLVCTSGGDASDSGLEVVELQMKYFTELIDGEAVRILYRGGCGADSVATAADRAKLKEAGQFAAQLLT